MGVAGVAAGVGATASLASAANGIANSGGGGGGGALGTQGGNPGTYIPEGQGQADQSYQSLTNQNDTLSQLGPSYVSAFQNNPYASGAQGAANNAGNYDQYTLSPQLNNAASSLFSAGNSVLNTAMDPQQALYNQQFQQTQDQANAINAMYGLSSSPYGAGVANQAATNFNIDWQNQQLARQQQGIQAAGAADSGAANLGNLSGQAMSGGGALPYSTYTGQLNDILGSIGQAQGLDNTTINNLAAYLGLGQSASGLAQSGQQTNFAQQQALGAEAGSSLSSLSSLFSGSSNQNNNLSNLYNSIFNSNGLSGSISSNTADELAAEDGTS